MPRRARLRLPGLPVHITQRGHDGADCFLHPCDYGCYVTQLRTLAAHCDCRLHAYALMTNHVHLLVTPDTPDAASLFIKHVGQRYVQYVNRRYARRGTLWDGRFRSSFIESTDHLLRCYRYIELNPVRAGLVDDPADYPWSSHRLNTGRSGASWLTPHEEYLKLGATPDARHAAYRGLFAYALDPEQVAAIRAAAAGPYALGSPAFQAHVAAVTGRRVTRLRPPRLRPPLTR